MNREFERQILHICFGLLIIFLLLFEALNTRILFFVLIFGILLSILSLKFKIPIIYLFLERFERKEQIKKFPGKGMIFFVLGCLLALRLFGKDIALPSIMILTLGDSISHIIGSKGKIKHFLNDYKNLEGSVLGFFASFLGVLFLIFVFNVDITILEGFFASLIGMIAEAIDFKIGLDKVDDNIIVPLAAGTIIYLIKMGSWFF